MKYIVPVLAIIMCFPSIAQAYIGPSVGFGVIGTILGIIGSVFLMVFGILYYPIKRFIRNRKSKKQS